VKARLQSLLAAEGIALDQLTGRFTAFNTIETILLASVPTQFTRVCAVAFYELGDEADQVVEWVSLVAPDGSVLIASKMMLNLIARVPGSVPNGHRSIHTLWRARFEAAGDYRVVVEHERDGARTEVGSLLITVVVQPHPILNTQAIGIDPSAPKVD